MTTFTIPTVPGEFQWQIPPLDWNLEPHQGLSILASAETDWFSDPAGNYTKDNAPCALVQITDDHFLLNAKVAVEFVSAFDAGAIQIRAAENLWAKFAFEYSPQRQPTIVSVVTRGVSDDCNSVAIDGSEIYLRVARTPQTLAFHYSHDGRVWHLVRYFTLGSVYSLRVGFSAQSPTGAQCRAVFSEIGYQRASLKDNRSGE
ncbi:MAG: DUF1349 domain-containing protein [Caldilineaceae bacterium]